MEIYTEKKHAQQSIRLLETPEACNHCVATYGHHLSPGIQRLFKCGARRSISELWENSNEVCKICTRFLGYSPEDPIKNNESSWCPCHTLGEKETFKRCWIALEEKGYLDMDDKCDECGEEKTVSPSWFTGQNICQKCLDIEDTILVRLANNDQDIWDYEGCGYIPKMDGSNWIEKDKQ